MDYLPIVAVVLSVASLVVSILNYLRDRPQIRIWAEIVYVERGSTPDEGVPYMLIRMANLGRRPAVLLSLRVKARSGTWSHPLKGPDLGASEEPVVLSEVARIVDQHMLAQNHAVKLAEGEIVDVRYTPEECPMFFNLRAQTPDPATALHVLGCAGKAYRVKGDKKALAKLIAAWAP